MQLAGKTVFITGGGGGIGGGIAQAFAEKGACIVLADISLDHAREQAALLPPATVSDIVELDVTSLSSWARARLAVEERFGTIDVLCNNAGVSAAFKPLVDMDAADFERVTRVNLYGPFYGVKTFVPDLIKKRAGHVINISSINGLLPNGGSATYSASKFAVTGMSDALRQELAPAGVGVSTVFPGLTRSRMAEHDIDLLAKVDPDRATGMRAAMMEPVLLGRMVVDAVENNRPYVMTHPAFLSHVTARTEEIFAAFGRQVR